MKRYFIRKNQETLEAVISMPLDSKPANSLEIYEHGFKNPTFKDESCTELIEGVIVDEPIKEEAPQEVIDFIETLKQKYNL